MTTTLSSNLRNIITVSPKHGDFTSVDAAIAAVAFKATKLNPFLVVIGPGVYTVSSTLKMVPYVNVKGSGVGITIIEGSIGASAYSATAAILAMSDNSQVSSLTIRNLGTSQACSIGAYFSQSSPSSELNDVYVSALGSADNVCALYCDSALCKITNSTVSANAPANNSTKTFAIVAQGTAAPFVENVKISGQGGAYAHGVFHSGQNNLEINNSSISSEGAAKTSYCIYVDSDHVRVRNSNVLSPNSSPAPQNSRYAVYANNAGASANFFSCVVDGPVGGPGNSNFYASFDSAGNIP